MGMDRHSNNILVIDPQAERAEEINSLLRNSGINAHVSHAGNAVDMERLLRDLQPTLCLLHPAAVPGIPLTKVCEAVTRHQVLLAVLCTPQDMEVLRQALEECASIAVNADDPDQLTTLVRHVDRSGHAGHDVVRLERQLAELQELHELLLRSTGDAIAYVHEGLHIDANHAYRAAVGVHDEAGLATISLLELMHARNEDFKTLVRELGQGRFPSAPVAVEVRPALGNSFEATVEFSPAQYEGEACVQVILRRLVASGAVHLPQLVAEQLAQDPLTGALARHAFMQKLQQYLEQPDGGMHVALFYLQPDGSDALVQELSASVLDHYLRSLAREIRTQLGDADVLGRFGEAAFTILARRSEREQLIALGENLRHGIESMSLNTRESRLPITASLGMVLLGTQDVDADTTLEQARATWRAATGDGNTLLRYKPALAGLDTPGGDREWAERLRYALNNGDFYSVQQVIVNLEGDSEGLFENHTLMHEETGDLPMAEFLPAAERNDLASNIDRHVIPGLLQAISGSGDRHIINISGNSVLDFSFPGWFHRQLQFAEVEGSQVILQISAATALRDLRTTRRLFEEIAPTGCTFSVAGIVGDRRHEALLGQLDLAFVKLSAELTHNLRERPANLQAVRNLVSIATQAGAQVLADQVHNSADMAALWQCGVKHLAGEFLQESSRVAG